ncbi:hypothetical protein M3184_28380, partial [Metabacillus litoralis]|nr:hypothetical protein [Metabacillus litoralis]
GADFSLVSRRYIRLWLSFDERNVLLCIPPHGASAYVLLTVMVCDEDTTANGPAMGGLSRCVLKGTRTVLREEGAAMPLTYPT